MNRIQLLLPLAFFALTLSAQKNDYNWIVGYSQPPSPTKNFESHQFDFNTYPFTQTVVSCNLICPAGCSTFSDDEGGFRFYSNGIAVYNSQLQLMENGNGINTFPGIIHTLPVGPPTDGPCSFSIKKPGAANHAYIFALEGEPELYALAQHLILTEIDLDANGGLGKVVSKGNALIKYDSLEQCSIFKHANGRDWWILAPQNFSNKYYRFLATPDGVQGPFIQNFGYNDYVSFGYRAVSKHGDYYAIASAAATGPYFQGIMLYDIDRCTGELSNEIQLPIPDFDAGYDGATIAFSPDGRYLYFGFNLDYNIVFPGSCLLQFDLKAPDILASRDTIHYGLFQNPSTNDTRISFGNHAVSAPDGKLYMPNHQQTYNVIHFPNRIAKDCKFQNRIRYNPNYPTVLYGDYSPFPNYRLGPIDGSSCDTLGLNNNPLANFRHDWEDSTLLRTRTFTDLSDYEPQTWHWNFGDGTTSQDTSPVHTFPANGVYNVCLTVCNQYSCDTLCQLVYVGVVAADEPVLSEEKPFGIYPNPADEHLFFQKTTASLDPEMEFVNALGQLAFHQKQAENGPILLPKLADGLYFVRFFVDGSLRQTEKLVIQHE